MSHKFNIGQNVRFNSSPTGRVGAAGPFTIIRLLPFEGEEHQYRIRNNGEAFERVARESQLDTD